MRALVTGIAGFAGGYLHRLLAGNDHTVFGTCLPQPANVIPGAKLLQCDIRNAEQVREAVRIAQPDRVYHLAALSMTSDSTSMWRDIYETNFIGTVNLLEAVSKLAPEARVLIVGSGQCYGSASMNGNLTERHPLLPANPYAVSKTAADLASYQYHVSGGLRVIRARPFNHTGPGQRPEFVCSDFARQIAAIELGLSPPLLEVGNLKPKRDFSDVRDVVRAYQMLLEKGRPGEAYNVCSGRARSIQDIVAKLRSFCKKGFRVSVKPSRRRIADALRLVGSNYKLCNATHWKPKFDFDSTLYELFCYWKSELQRAIPNAL